MKQEVLKLQTLLNGELKQAEKKRKEYESQLAEFTRNKQSALEKEVASARKKIDEMIQVEGAKDVFRRHERLEKIKYEMPQIIVKGESSGSTSGGQTGLNEIFENAEDFAQAYPPGSSVHILSLGRDGIVQGRPNSKGEIPVLSNSMHLQIPWEQLKTSRISSNPTQKILRKSTHFSYSPADEDRVVDIRGLSSEDAISQLEIQLDAASLGDEDRVKIVHGHGTNTLKRSVRGYLSRSVYVKKWTAGTNESGGDGITWVELK